MWKFGASTALPPKAALRQSSHLPFLLVRLFPFLPLHLLAHRHHLTPRPDATFRDLKSQPFPPAVIISMQYISRPPRIFIPRENGGIVSSWIPFERAGHTNLLKLWGVCRRNGKIVTQVPFPGSTSKVTKREQQCPAALKSQRERVKFKTWIASLFSLCIICQSRVKSGFCPPAASPGVHISITRWCAFLRNSAGKINDFTFLSRKGRLFSHFFLFFFFSF